MRRIVIGEWERRPGRAARGRAGPQGRTAEPRRARVRAAGEKHSERLESEKRRPPTAPVLSFVFVIVTSNDFPFRYSRPGPRPPARRRAAGRLTRVR